MRYYVAACFTTDAPGLVLSSSPGEDSAVIVAEDCHAALHFSTMESGAPRLTVLPWDSSQMRLCVNGISYGTGPLLLREGDTLTLQAMDPSTARAPHEYTYSITALPDPPAAVASPSSCSASSSPAATAAPAGSGGATLSTEEQRPYAVVRNMAEYAKWNNFYGDRFGNCAPEPAAAAAVVRGRQNAVPIRKCVCGCCAPQEKPVLTTSRIEASSVAVPSWAGTAAAASRTLVTLFPSIPTLLAEEARVEQRGEAPAPEVLTCCACPFLQPHPSRGAIKVIGRSNAEAKPTSSSAEVDKAKNDEAAGSQVNAQGNNTRSTTELDLSEPSTVTSAWARYVAACKKGWNQEDPALHVEGSECKDAVPTMVLDRPSAELLLRIHTVESALMGCRYE
ncbi:hypothetical protein N2W54_004758 [Lotmaria passim]